MTVSVRSCSCGESRRSGRLTEPHAVAAPSRSRCPSKQTRPIDQGGYVLRNLGHVPERPPEPPPRRPRPIRHSNATRGDGTRRYELADPSPPRRVRPQRSPPRAPGAPPPHPPPPPAPTRPPPPSAPSTAPPPLPPTSSTAPIPSAESAPHHAPALAFPAPPSPAAQAGPSGRGPAKKRGGRPPEAPPEAPAERPPERLPTGPLQGPEAAGKAPGGSLERARERHGSGPEAARKGAQRPAKGAANGQTIRGPRSQTHRPLPRPPPPPLTPHRQLPPPPPASGPGASTLGNSRRTVTERVRYVMCWGPALTVDRRTGRAPAAFT